MADTIDAIVGGGDVPVAGTPSNTPDPSSGNPDGTTQPGGDFQEQIRGLSKERNLIRQQWRQEQAANQQLREEVAELRGMVAASPGSGQAGEG
jgi:hypothetical protein